ncbi:MAG: energy transducer TonB [Bacteroidia bacterium]
MKSYLLIFTGLLFCGTLSAQISTSDGVIYQSDSTYKVKGFSGIEEVKSSGAVQGLIQPQALNMKEITDAIGYPQAAKDKRTQGTVIVRLLVDEYGNYNKHHVVKETDPVLLAEVEKHLYKLKFRPATNGGKAIPFWVNLPFSFRLDK